MDGSLPAVDADIPAMAGVLLDDGRLELAGTGVELSVVSVDRDATPYGRRASAEFRVDFSHRTPVQTTELVHGTGRDDEEAFEAAVAGWVRQSLPVYRDVVAGRGQNSSVVEYADDRVRFWLGPMFYADEGGQSPCCAGCLFAPCVEEFLRISRGRAVAAIRLFAIRDEAGEVLADVVVDGVLDEAASERLAEVATGWTGTGAVMRRQTVLLTSTAGAGTGHEARPDAAPGRIRRFVRSIFGDRMSPRR